MRIAKRMLLNGLMLAVVSLLMRFAGLAFNVYLSNKLGAAGIGLIGLIMSVFGFGVTLATSGINLTTTRLVAEELAHERSDGGVRRVMRRCICYALCFSTTAGTLLFLLAPIVGAHVLDDVRTVMPLRILAVSLPATSLISCISGYFTASRRVYKGAVGSVLNQTVCMLLAIYCFYFLIPNGILNLGGDGSAATSGGGAAVIAITAGSVIAEFAGLCYSVVMYRVDVRLHNKRATVAATAGSSPLTRKMLRIALPLAFSAYVRSALSTLEHLLIPRGLKKNGADSASALASYGKLHGMAFPIVFFPAGILSSFTSLIVPEFAEYAEKGEHTGIERISARIIQIALLFSIGISGALLCFSSSLGEAIYKSAEVGKYLRYIAPLIPIMYFDTSVDYMLKGLGEQVYCMRVNIVDSALSVLLILFLLPNFGIIGYIIEVFVCELVNFTLSYGRLSKVVRLRLRPLRNILLPILCIAGGAALSSLTLTALPALSPKSACFVGIPTALVIYAILLRATTALTHEDMRWIRGLFRTKSYE